VEGPEFGVAELLGEGSADGGEEVGGCLHQNGNSGFLPHLSFGHGCFQTGREPEYLPGVVVEKAAVFIDPDAPAGAVQQGYSQFLLQ